MSTRDLPPSEAPAEARLGVGAAPSSGALLTSAPTSAPSPGLSPAILRASSAPTLPDWDPTALGQAMLHLANELFSAPPTSAAPAVGVEPAATADADSLAPTETAPPTAAPLPSPAPLATAAPLPSPAPHPAAAPTTAPAAGIAPVLLTAPASRAAPASTPDRPHVDASPSVAQTTARQPQPAAPAPSAALAAAPPATGEPASPFSAPLDLDALAALLQPGLAEAPALTELARPGELSLLEPASASAQPYWLPAAELAPASSPPPATAVASATAPAPAAAPTHSWLALEDHPPPTLARPTSPTLFDAHAVAREFPILRERVNGKRLVWLDNAATTQKPQAVIDRLSHFYTHENSNIHRAAHTLAARATEAYEQARASVRRFLNASSTEEIVFVRGATEGINLVAQSWGRRNVHAGDEIVLTWLEHHANIVPWQQLAAERGARLRVAPVDDRGQILLDEYDRLLGPRTRLVAMTQVSNALGTITPARQMIELAHRRGIPVLLDGAQAVSHLRVDVQALDCDFYVLSGHKVFGPTGIGALYGKRELLEAMPPWQGGGNMIQDVSFERTSVQGPPARFEAGTGNIADAVGLGAALDWLGRLGLEAVTAYEHELLEYATAELATVPGLTMMGTAPHKAGVLSFVLAGVETQAVGGLLDRDGIAVRSGHHCAQPILRRFGVEATVRASLAPYNTREDIDALVAALRRLMAKG